MSLPYWPPVPRWAWWWEDTGKAMTDLMQWQKALDMPWC